ncbi:hypothetical protein H5410_007214, partial [Solanum commersonii]
ITRSSYNLCHSLCPSGEHSVVSNLCALGDVNRTRQVLCDRLNSESIEGDRSRVIRVDNYPPNQLSNPEGQFFFFLPHHIKIRCSI